MEADIRIKIWVSSIEFRVSQLEVTSMLARLTSMSPATSGRGTATNVMCSTIKIRCHRDDVKRNVSRGVRQVFVGLVDPGDGFDFGCLGSFAESVRVGRVGLVEDVLASSPDLAVAAGVDVCWGVVADA